MYVTPGGTPWGNPGVTLDHLKIKVFVHFLAIPYPMMIANFDNAEVNSCSISSLEDVDLKWMGLGYGTGKQYCTFFHQLFYC